MSPILTFVLEKQWCSNMVSNFTSSNGVRDVIIYLHVNFFFGFFCSYESYYILLMRHEVDQDIINTSSHRSHKQVYYEQTIIKVVRHVGIHQQNANKWLFVCVTNSHNFTSLFHKKVISLDPLQKVFSNMTRTCKT